ncbi:MAG: energy transducer TonB [Pyrinomonadaceae bacterium]
MKNQREFRVTMLDNASLPGRLAGELRFLFYQLRLAWPGLKRDPIGFSSHIFRESWLHLRQAAAPSSLAALAAAMSVVFSAVLLLVLIGNKVKQSDPPRRETGEMAQLLEFPSHPDAVKEDKGVGVGDKGRVGILNGRGEGSGPRTRKSTGGGTGGLHDPLPAQVGKLTQPSEIPAPIPKLPPVQKSALPVAGIDIDPALWKNLAMSVYGDPRSKSSVPSNGPGDGGGMGTNFGSGVGDGRGPGFGPGEGCNTGGEQKGLGCCGSGGSQGNNIDDPDRVYPPAHVTERVRVLAKPEPQYTEEARRKAVTGSVVLRVVFSRDGEVTNIRAVQALPFGLTERAIAAARLIRFRPATREGRPVNVYMQLEYNFNLY